MAVSPLTPQIADELELPRNETGLVVTDVDPAGVAASVGIQAGDVIKQVNERDVPTVAALRAAIATRTDRPALLLVQRHGASQFVALPRERS
jgi:serine protease Do